MQFYLGFTLEGQEDCYLRELPPLEKSKCIFSDDYLNLNKRSFGLFLEYTKATSKLSQSAIRSKISINVIGINHIHCNYVNVAWNATCHFNMLLVLLGTLQISKLKDTNNA